MSLLDLLARTTVESNQGENQKTSKINDKRTEHVQALKIKDDTKNTEIQKIDTEHHAPSRILQKGKNKYPQRSCILCRRQGTPHDTDIIARYVLTCQHYVDHHVSRSIIKHEQNLSESSDKYIF